MGNGYQNKRNTTNERTNLDCSCSSVCCFSVAAAARARNWKQKTRFRMEDVPLFACTALKALFVRSGRKNTMRKEKARKHLRKRYQTHANEARRTSTTDQIWNDCWLPKLC